jgi:hypothetical protein
VVTHWCSQKYKFPLIISGSLTVPTKADATGVLVVSSFSSHVSKKDSSSDQAVTSCVKHSSNKQLASELLVALSTPDKTTMARSTNIFSFPFLNKGQDGAAQKNTAFSMKQFTLTLQVKLALFLDCCRNAVLTDCG